ncbi:DNA (cytosine-5-)-methyltransferase [Candidatus Parcubacteria bacterium]|nr:MAG: DNA (cytosine-5-)-methyltransferase [Candidatus Parcubacteria bacterium]
MKSEQKKHKHVDFCTVVDLFAGAGGLTHGFVCEGFHVAAGYDADPSFEYVYERNNPGARFVPKKIEDLTLEELSAWYPDGHVKILAGCAPCQPFSAYTRIQGRHQSWALLYEFSRLIESLQPEIVTMENVPRLQTFDGGNVFRDFLNTLERCGYQNVANSWKIVYAPDYGVPQTRKRLILIASKWGPVEFLRHSHHPGAYRTVRETIGHLPPIEAGSFDPSDPVHAAMGLSQLNMQRIKASLPGGTWRDWPEELRAACHTKDSGRTYKNVYGRMVWDDLAPTITTQCYGFGNGRFGHPEQDRAISMREAALLQTFPGDYQFFDPTKHSRPPITRMATMIGNAVPVALGRMIAKSIRLHIRRHRGWLREP